MSITIRVNKNNSSIRLNMKKLQKLTRTVCRHFKVKRTVVEIEIVGDYQIRKMNRKYLKKNRITDCISFDLTGKSKTNLYLIVVNAQRAAREAIKRQQPKEAELLLYILHGLLHNLGFDDRKKRDAALMHKTEDAFLQQIGCGLVYNSGKNN